MAWIRQTSRYGPGPSYTACAHALRPSDQLPFTSWLFHHRLSIGCAELDHSDPCCGFGGRGKSFWKRGLLGCLTVVFSVGRGELGGCGAGSRFRCRLRPIGTRKVRRFRPWYVFRARHEPCPDRRMGQSSALFCSVEGVAFRTRRVGVPRLVEKRDVGWRVDLPDKQARFDALPK